MLPKLVWTSVALCAVLDLAARFLPPRQIAFRAWEGVSVYPVADGPFTPNEYYDRLAFGDLANMANLPALREYRRERFTTDPYGFRNSPATVPPGPTAVIIAGDSFTGGAGLSDEDTLGAQLAIAIQHPVYNASGLSRWSTFKKVIARSGMRNGLVIWQVSERFPIHASYINGGASRSQLWLARLFGEDSAAFRAFQSAGRLTTSLPAYSPLRIQARRLVASVQDDVFFPRAGSPAVIERPLRNGQRMLFLQTELEAFAQARRANIRGLAEVANLVRQEGHQFLVLAVPNKYTVYQPWIVEHTPLAAPHPTYLETLVADLSQAGIPALDLTDPLRAEAAALWPQNRYCYYRDDTHWNPAGVRRAVAEIVRLFPR